MTRARTITNKDWEILYRKFGNVRQDVIAGADGCAKAFRGLVRAAGIAGQAFDEMVYSGPDEASAGGGYGCTAEQYREAKSAGDS